MEQENGGYKNLNLYQGVRGLSVKILNRIDRTDAYLDKLLDVEIKHSNLSGIDKALLFEIVHGVSRWLGKIDWILTGFYKGQFAKCIPNVKNAMRVALYQILFLDRVPDYAAVNEAVDFVKKLQGKRSADLTNAVLRNIIRSKDAIRYPDEEDEEVNYLSAFYSHPTWMVKRWLKRFGKEETVKLLIANNNKPILTLRVNNLKTSKEELKELLKKVKLEFTDANYLDRFIRLTNLTNITEWEYFEKGYFSVQDESTGLPVELLDPQPGERVLDLCAAPGGKTSYMADLMKNEGELVAIDKFESRLKILQDNQRRMGVTNVRTVTVDALEFAETSFDKILVDAPCSGLGTLTKKPDIKWKRDVGDIRRMSETQYLLMEKAAELVKDGGTIVYSTCTTEPEENSEVVNKFLFNHPNFEIINASEKFDEEVLDENGCVQTYSHKHGMDGAFAAKLKRKY